MYVFQRQLKVITKTYTVCIKRQLPIQWRYLVLFNL